MTPTAEARTGPAPLSAVPSVSVIVPVLNEERHLRDAVQMILAQDYDGPLEVVLALGPSKDRTDEVAAGLAAADPRVRTVANPSGKTPNALNAAIAASWATRASTWEAAPERPRPSTSASSGARRSSGSAATTNTSPVPRTGR